MSSANIKNIFNHLCHKTFKSLCAFTGMLILAGTIFSQNVQYMGGSEDLSLRGNAGINPTTLGMELKIPLQSYAGRGGTSLPVVLFYSSKVWRMDYGGYVIEGPQGMPQDVYSWLTANYGDYNNHIGWTSSLDFPIKLDPPPGEYYDSNGFPCGSDCGVGNQFYVRRVRIKMQDGSVNEFRADDKVYSVSQQPQFPLTYYSVDSSRMRYVDEGNGQATMYMPDGSRYLMGQGVFIDRNGNKLVRQSNNWVDTLGREIPVPSLTPPQSSGDTTYTLPSFDGSTSTYTFRWRAMSTIRSDAMNQPLAPIGFRNPYNPQICSDSLFWNSAADTRIGPIDMNCTGFDTIVLSEIELPNGGKYKFQYNQYGEITKVIYPTGAYERFRYEQVDALDSMNEPYAQLNRGVRERWVGIENSSQNEMHWQYLTGSGATQYSVTTTVPDGSKNVRIYTKGRGPNKVYGFDDVRAGSLVEEISYSSTNQILSRTLNSYSAQGVRGVGAHPTATRDARLEKQIFVSFEPGDLNALVILKKNEYDSDPDLDYYAYLNVNNSMTYGYAATTKTAADDEGFSALEALFTSLTPVSHTQTIYQYDSNYKSRGILSLPIETRILNPGNPTEILSKSQFLYDEQEQYYSMIDYGSTLGYETPTGGYAHLRGNITTLQTWNKDTTSWIKIHNQFDNFGNQRKVWDSSGDPTRFVETEYSSQYYYAYPTSMITPAPDPSGLNGSSQSSSVSTTYDLSTGLPLTVSDTNDQITAIEYDARLRPKKVTPPAGGAISEKEYGDTPGNLYVKTKIQVDSQNWAESTSYVDGLGRVYKTQSKDSQGDIFTEAQFDNFGRIKQVSSPYRTGDQMFWSKLHYDNVGRVVGTYAPAPDGQTGASLGLVEFGISTIQGYVGNYTETTDPSGRKARSLTNVFGQIIRVDEPTGNNDLGTLENPNQPSYYIYNIKSELIKTQQGQQNRYFMYDSLGRLIRVKQPEQIPNLNLATTGNPENNQWTLGYSYDIFGNVITVRDAKDTIITNDYDKSGRIKRTTYSDGTPQVDCYYDGTGLGLSQLPQYARGSLTRISNGVSETRYTNFDNYGRALAGQQITDGTTYNFGYKYDSIGNLTETTYPSLRVVKTHLDVDGGLAAVSSKTANSNYKSYASNFSYTPTGNVKAMMLGNGRWETAKLNSLLQLEQVGLGNSSADTSLWNINYEYGELNPDGSVNTNKNIGSVAKQTITLPNASFVQTYKYDALNRLKEAKEMTGTVTGTENWKQTFDYDRYGNRTAFYQKVGEDVLPINNITLPEVVPETNRFKTTQGYTYDFNGNLIQNAENKSFAYNGDDKQTEVRDLTIPTSSSNPNANVVGKYYYDGEGKRVKKVTNTETTVFVYDGAGVLAAEYSTQTPTNPNTSYLTTDHLGSPRVITDKQGNVVSRRDFMPFGEEILAGVGGRDAVNQKYTTLGVDNIRQRFTGYEKDIESELDFAEARMYQNKHGRFTAPDPLLASANLPNPQTFNRYVYVGNNPTNITDPSGLDWCLKNGTNDDIRNAGKDGRCNSGETNIDGTTRKAGDGDWAKYGAKKDDTIKFFSDGTIKVVRSSQGNIVGEVTVEAGASEQISTEDTGITADITSALVTLGENNGGSALYALGVFDPYHEHTKTGQFIGNVLSLLQGAAEIVHGAGTTIGGAAATVATVPLCATIIGCAVPATTATISAVGLLEIIHGVGVIGNTVYNMSNNQGEGSRSGNSTLEPGPFTGDSIPARGPERDFTKPERDAMNKIGKETGCHTCGSKDPRTKSGDFVPDHQPPNKLNPQNGPQRLYPHCKSCSRRQGGQVRAATR